MLRPRQRPLKIISGGQTGADQGGLAGAKQIGITTGGTAPKFYLTESGPMAELLKSYGLVESGSTTYVPRTRKNVQDAQGTLWVGNVGSPGYKCTMNACRDFNRPSFDNPSPEQLRDWVERWNITTLNVAGNRESKNPGIHDRTKQLIIDAFGWE